MYKRTLGKSIQIENTVFLSFLLIIVDCILTGYGYHWQLGRLSVRILLWGYCILGFITLHIFRMKELSYSDSLVMAIIFFGLYFIFQALRGYVLGNSSQIIFNDIRGYSWIALALAACVIFDNSIRINRMLNTIVIASFLLVILILLAFTLSVFSANKDSVFLQFIIEYQISSISRISDSIIRFSSGNLLYIVPAIIYLFFSYVVSKERLFISVFITSLGLVVILLSYTRSYYLGALSALLLSIIILLRVVPGSINAVVVFCSLALSISLFLLLLFGVFFKENYLLIAFQRIFPTINFSNFGLLRTSRNLTQTLQVNNYIQLTVQSDVIRNQTMNGLIGLMKNNLLFGNGLGSGVEFRELGRVEYFYQDLLQKLGIVGMFLYLYPIILIIKQSIWHFVNKVFTVELVFYLGLVAFLISSYFNPIMNSSIGICYYSICIGVLYNSRRRKYVSIEKN